VRGFTVLLQIPWPHLSSHAILRPKTETGHVKLVHKIAHNLSKSKVKVKLSWHTEWDLVYKMNSQITDSPKCTLGHTCA